MLISSASGGLCRTEFDSTDDSASTSNCDFFIDGMTRVNQKIHLMKMPDNSYTVELQSSGNGERCFSKFLPHLLSVVKKLGVNQPETTLKLIVRYGSIYVSENSSSSSLPSNINELQDKLKQNLLRIDFKPTGHRALNDYEDVRSFV